MKKIIITIAMAVVMMLSCCSCGMSEKNYTKVETTELITNLQGKVIEIPVTKYYDLKGNELPDEVVAMIKD